MWVVESFALAPTRNWQRFANRVGAPVVTTLMARGAFPDSSPLNLGMPGMHGTVPAVLSFQEADLLVVLGARFDDRVTGKPSDFRPPRQSDSRRH
jgi:acetolactate synthase-1/2/3 large subunit